MILPDTEVHPTHAKLTHAVDILAFVEAQEIPFHYFDTPYYLAPAPGGEKLYALLRETLHRSGKIGIAYVVIRARQHLAALVPQGQSLVLNTLRWASETGLTAGFGLPAEDLAAAKELGMMVVPGAGPGYDKRYLAWRQDPFRPGIVVEELGDLNGDADADDVFAAALDRKLHASVAAAVRRNGRRTRRRGARLHPRLSRR